VNGSEIGTEKNNGNGTVLFKNVSLSMGKNEVEAFSADASGGQTKVKDRCIIERVPEEEKSYRLPDSGAGSAVKNWFLSDDDTVREGYCSIKDSANDLLENSEAKVVLEKHLPELVKCMLTKDVIPLGLSLESILSRNTPEGLDIKKLNKDLNEIPALM
jgi:beta-galactosidase